MVPDNCCLDALIHACKRSARHGHNCSSGMCIPRACLKTLTINRLCCVALLVGVCRLAPSKHLHVMHTPFNQIERWSCCHIPTQRACRISPCHEAQNSQKHMQNRIKGQHDHKDHSCLVLHNSKYYWNWLQTDNPPALETLGH